MSKKTQTKKPEKLTGKQQAIKIVKTIVKYPFNVIAAIFISAIIIPTFLSALVLTLGIVLAVIGLIVIVILFLALLFMFAFWVAVLTCRIKKFNAEVEKAFSSETDA